MLYNTTDLVVNEKSASLGLILLYFQTHDANLANMVTIPSNICNITTSIRNIAKQYDQEEEETHKVTSPNNPIKVSKIPAVYLLSTLYFNMITCRYKNNYGHPQIPMGIPGR